MHSEFGVKRFAANVIAPAVVVPGALLVGVFVLYRFHRTWRWIRIGLLWSDLDNFVQLSAGAAANHFFGDRVPLRVAALMVWIPSRLVACMDEYHKLSKAYLKWVEAVRGDYPRAMRVHWVQASSKPCVFSPAQRIWLEESALVIRMRLERVSVRTYKLVKRMFILSMTCVDAAEALSLKKSSCDRAINEFFLDGVNALDRIASKKEEVQDKLETNRLLANKLLRKLGTHHTVDRLISCVSTAMDGIELADKGVKNVTEFGNGIAKDMVKQAVFGIFSLLGIPGKIPAKWLPGQWEKDHFEDQPYEQYIPDEYITLPSMLPRTGENIALEERQASEPPAKALQRGPLKNILPVTKKVKGKIKRFFS